MEMMENNGNAFYPPTTDLKNRENIMSILKSTKWENNNSRRFIGNPTRAHGTNYSSISNAIYFSLRQQVAKTKTDNKKNWIPRYKSQQGKSRGKIKFIATEREE